MHIFVTDLTISTLLPPTQLSVPKYYILSNVTQVINGRVATSKHCAFLLKAFSIMR